MISRGGAGKKVFAAQKFGNLNAGPRKIFEGLS
jgi:hypothetical protein